MLHRDEPAEYLSGICRDAMETTFNKRRLFALVPLNLQSLKLNLL
jgi:hypothetical protein